MVILLLLHSHLDFLGQMAQIEPLKNIIHTILCIKIKENMNQILLIGNLPSKNRHALQKIPLFKRRAWSHLSLPPPLQIDVL